MAWGIWGPGEPVKVELIFAPSVARRVQETTWHPSQEVTQLADGRLRLTVRVSSWLEMRHWVLGWGETCEVIGPPELRSSIRATIASLAHTYGTGTPPARRPGQRLASRSETEGQSARKPR